MRLAAVLALLVPLASLAWAQVYRIETLLGDFDPLEAVPLAEAWVRYPTAVAIDLEGSLYFVDRDSYRVRKVDSSGRVTTVAGSGLFGYSGDGGPATSARLGERVEGLAVDREGNVYIADTENYRIRRVDPTGTIETIAGTGAWGTGGDGGPATSAGLTAVYGLAVDVAGNLYIADTWDDRIRKIDSDGVITTVAGVGEEGLGGDGGPATEARLDKPHGVAVDSSGGLYIADSDNHRVRRVDPRGTITTIAGTGHRGFRGDGGPGTEAALAEPHAVTVDAVGAVYVADSGNGVVRRVNPDGTIATVAGFPPQSVDGPIDLGGSLSIGFPRSLALGFAGELYIADSYRDAILRLDARGTIGKFVGLGMPVLDRPGGAAVDSSGNVLIADRTSHRILKVDDVGIATTVAGSGEHGDSGDGGPATNADFSFPSDVAVGTDGTIYIADSDNHRIRMVDAAGTVTTFAGTGEPGFGGDGGPALSAMFDSPSAVAVGADQAVYVADQGNHRIRKIDVTGVVTTVAGNGEYGDGQAGIAATQSPLGRFTDLAVDSQGRIYTPEASSDRVLTVDLAGILTVAAGTGDFGAHGDGGPAVDAQLWSPSGVAVSESDTLYIADTLNNLIRRVTSDGTITTIAGSGLGGYDGDGRPATLFSLHRPEGVAVASDETLIVVDSGNYRVRVLTAEAPPPMLSSILNAASYVASVAPDSVAVLRGTDLAPGISAGRALPRSLPLPTALLDTSVTVIDRTETSWARRVAGLYFVSPTEIRFQVPRKAAKGLVLVTVNRKGSVSEPLAIGITNVAPGLFSANGDGRGVAAATAVRVARTGTETPVQVSRFDTVLQSHVAVPIDVTGDMNPIYLTLFGTGFRGGIGPPTATIAGQPVALESSGPASGFHGVDELVVGPIPRSIQGQSLDIVVSVDARVSNAVTIAVK